MESSVQGGYEQEMTYSLYGYASRRTKAEILGSTPHVKSKIIARNTVWYEKPDGRIGVIFHRTKILEQVEGGWHVSFGGWPTTTTASRLHKVLKAYVNPNLYVWRVGSYGSHNIYLCTKTQMVPINDGLFVPDDLQLEERSCSQDSLLRQYMWYSRNWGQPTCPTEIEWDGRASTLRKHLVGWWNRQGIPIRLMKHLPGIKMVGGKKDPAYRENHIRWKLVNKPILLRNLAEQVYFAGHIDNIKEKAK